MRAKEWLGVCTGILFVGAAIVWPVWDKIAAAIVDIVKASYGRDPLVAPVVDVGEGAAPEIRAPPSHVKWGAISTPMF
jgi:hypothetical protein